MSDREDMAVILLAAMTQASRVMADAVAEVTEILLEEQSDDR